MLKPPSGNSPLPSIRASALLLQEAERLIPAATQTLAKGQGQHVRGVAPAFADRGKGCRLWDVDGNEYIDWTMGVGPLVLGYCFAEVDCAIREQLEKGITFSLVHPLEVEVAELVTSIVPNAEAVRFSKTGADATSAAVRVARAYTGRDIVLCCGYHGWHDWYIATTDRNAGIPQQTSDLTYTFHYNNIESLLDSIGSDVACVILEPTVFDQPENSFLHEVRRICDEHGVLLVFDEMWTGFRLAMGGAQEYFGVRADLACFSKAVANGMPLSIVTGRADVMRMFERDVFFFTTFGGEALSLAAAKATLTYMQANNVIATIAERGAAMIHGYNQIAQSLGLDYTAAKGYPCRSMITFSPDVGNPLVLKSFMQQELLRRGVLWGGFHNMCFSHEQSDIHHTLESYRQVLEQLHEAVQNGTVEMLLEGRPMEPVFRKVGNFNTKPRIVGHSV